MNYKWFQIFDTYACLYNAIEIHRSSLKEIKKSINNFYKIDWYKKEKLWKKFTKQFDFYMEYKNPAGCIDRILYEENWKSAMQCAFDSENWTTDYKTSEPETLRQYLLAKANINLDIKTKADDIKIWVYRREDLDSEVWPEWIKKAIVNQAFKWEYIPSYWL